MQCLSRVRRESRGERGYDELSATLGPTVDTAHTAVRIVLTVEDDNGSRASGG